MLNCCCRGLYSEANISRHVARPARRGASDNFYRVTVETDLSTQPSTTSLYVTQRRPFALPSVCSSLPLVCTASRGAIHIGHRYAALFVPCPLTLLTNAIVAIITAVGDKMWSIRPPPHTLAPHREIIVRKLPFIRADGGISAHYAAAQQRFRGIVCPLSTVCTSVF